MSRNLVDAFLWLGLFIALGLIKWRVGRMRERKTLGGAASNSPLTVSQSISALSEPQPQKRRASAQNLFALGQDLSLGIISKWGEDAEFDSIARFPIRFDPKKVKYGKVGSSSTEFRCTVGIAVRPETFERIRHSFGSPPLASVPPDQDAMEFEIDFEAQNDHEQRKWIEPLSLDILTTKDPVGSGAIAKFLARNGEGIQQVEYEVKDVDRATRILVEKFGQNPIYPATRAGANGTRVNFFLVPTDHEKLKVLIELVEAAKTK